MFSFAGDMIVDPFAGTGTTALAALETGRNSINVEIEPSYVEMMATRLQSERLGAIVKVDRSAPKSHVVFPAAAAE